MRSCHTRALEKSPGHPGHSLKSFGKGLLKQIACQTHTSENSKDETNEKLPYKALKLYKVLKGFLRALQGD